MTLDGCVDRLLDDDRVVFNSFQGVFQCRWMGTGKYSLPVQGDYYYVEISIDRPLTLGTDIVDQSDSQEMILDDGHGFVTILGTLHIESCEEEAISEDCAEKICTLALPGEWIHCEVVGNHRDGAFPVAVSCGEISIYPFEP